MKGYLKERAGAGMGRREGGGGRGEQTLLELLFHTKPKRKRFKVIFGTQKDYLALSLSSVCAFSIARHFMSATVCFCRLKCLVTRVPVFVLLLGRCW